MNNINKYYSSIRKIINTSMKNKTNSKEINTTPNSKTLITMNNYIIYCRLHGSTPREDKIYSRLLIGTQTIHSGVYIQAKYSVMLRETYYKNVMKNTLSLNHIREAPSQEQEETCMQYSQHQNQQMDQGEILHLVCIPKNKNQYRLMNVELCTQESPKRHTSRK